MCTSEKKKTNRKLINTVYFSMDRNSKAIPFSERWEKTSFYIDNDSQEIVIKCKSRWNKDYDVEKRVSL